MVKEEEEDVLDKIREAKKYVDQAIDSCIANFEKGEKELECLKAVEDTAGDLNYEAWNLTLEINCAIKGFPPSSEDEYQWTTSHLGTREIPEMPDARG